MVLKKGKGKFFRATILSGFAFFIFHTTLVPQTHAWGDAFPAAMMKFSMETVRLNIMGTLLGTAKVAAIQAINQQVNMLIAGASYGQPLIISNWEQYLYTVPSQNTDAYIVSDWILRSTQGKYSSANYLGIGDPKSIVGNYKSYLVAQAKIATVDAARQAVVMTLDEYTSSPEAMFREGDFRAFNAFISNPANNPYGYVLMAEQAYQTKLAEELRIAEVKAQSSGFLGVERNGMTITPAGAIQALNSMDIQNMGNIITGATNPGELASGVAMAVANRMVTQMVQQGIGSVGNKIQQQVNNVKQQANAALNDATKIFGPAAPYVNATVKQQITNVQINGINGAVPIPPPNSPSVNVDEAFRSVGVDPPSTSSSTNMQLIRCQGAQSGILPAHRQDCNRPSVRGLY